MDTVTPSRDATEETAALLDLIGGKWSTQAVGAAAQLGLADHLARGPQALDELARASGCDPASLRRLLRALESLGVCREQPDGAFALTPMGGSLRSDAPHSLRAYAMWTAQFQWEPWGQLAESVRTGQAAPSRAGGRDAYGHVARDPRAAAIFNRAMEEMATLIAQAVASAPIFASARCVMDVGGGHGELGTAILAAHPALHGVIFDLPHAMAGAGANIARLGLAERCRAISGSFFESVPAGADVHLLKSVMHNWDDGRCGQILSRCREALAPGGHVAIIERLLPEHVSGDFSERLVLRGDLNMLVGLGGRERTLAQFGALLGAAGLRLGNCAPLPVGYSLLTAS